MTTFILHYPAQSFTVHNRASVLSSSDDLPIRFSLLGATSDIEARWGNGEWQTIQSSARGSYSVTLPNCSGQATLHVRPAAYPALEVVRDGVGIGDVFLVAGQSNASGRGTNNQSWSHASLTPRLFANDYQWKTLADPTDSDSGTVDTATQESGLTPPGGSVWPKVATDIMAATGCPVAFIPTAKGATGIAQWARGATPQSRSSLYGQSISRVYASTGWAKSTSAVRLVVWWQGEGDTTTMTSTAYKSALITLATGYVDDIGAKLIATRLQLTQAGMIENVNNAIVAAASESANVFVGADLSDIATDDAAHLMTDAKLTLAGERIAAAILAALGI